MKLIIRSALCLWSLAAFALEPGAVPDPSPSPSPPPPAQLADTKASPPMTGKPVAQVFDFEHQLELAVQLRVEGNFTLATQSLLVLLQTNAPPELQRRALLELARVSQDNNQWIKAQQIFAQYIHRYPDSGDVPQVLLWQGLLYRKMGVNGLAAAKFYAVMSSALKLKLDDIEYYKKLVLQAQIEIADTYYLEGKYQESSEFYGRILKTDTPGADPEQIQLKLVRSLSYLTNNPETIASAQMFLEQYTNSANTAEIRFLLASSLKNVGRIRDSMQQVLMLLQAQQDNSQKDPQTWVYWQQRAGNEIANQFYKEGDFLEALEIYRNLATVNKSAAWQVPVWYQVGLVYEQLQQWQKATDTYDAIATRQKEMSPTNTPPTLASLFDMAKWRKDYVVWLQKASAANLALVESATNDPAPPIK
jgi:outer membrane protein assembly factor BamD (BamD/ComL family)